MYAGLGTRSVINEVEVVWKDGAESRWGIGGLADRRAIGGEGSEIREYRLYPVSFTYPQTSRIGVCRNSQATITAI